MATDRRDLAGVWTVLESSPSPTGISIAPLGVRVAAGDVLAGIDSVGRRHILIPLGPGEAAKTNTRGRGVQLARLTHEGVSYLTVFCLIPELHADFTQFGKELVESIEKAPSPAREASDALERWRQLFSDAAAGGGLGIEALIGLMGELMTLRALINSGLPTSLEAWEGPLNRVHDFRTVGHAIEVKTTLTREGRIVQISNVDQLQPPPDSDLVLRHIRLDHDPAGFNLEDLVNGVLSAGADSDALRTLLLHLDVRMEHLDAYRGHRFREVETRHYDASAVAFPKIVRDSFQGRDLPPGTLHLRYAIDLTNEPPHPLSDAEVHDAITRFTEEASVGLDS